MAENEEEKGFVEEREVALTEVELKVSPNNGDVVEKVIWQTSEGKITWKPKIDKVSYEGGFKIAKKIPMERDQLPELLIKMAAECNEKGKILIKVGYNYWKTNVDGAEQTYRFIMAEKTFNEKWSIVPEQKVIEECVK